ncbi:hypothetical protein TSUD_357950 [Trifolium subterraneum]|uniref:Integrase catalytic domain-containing protein n=1 Tax=Trifolium subterraneum TaxID=3900 RepID=A0A2Z6MKI6_TRISU|nr:hypothetical protein TSUD_357950 [Trifolium subterraneum]
MSYSFLHSAHSNNPKLQQQLCNEEVRESDMVRDGKVSFREFFLRLFHLVRKYDEENCNDPHHSDDSMDASAKLLFLSLTNIVTGPSMAENKDFGFPIPKFDGHYDHWSMLMENLLQSKEYWSIVETGVPILAANATAEQTRIGSNKVKRAQLQALRGEFEILRMKEDESVNDYFGGVLAIVNKMKMQGETMEHSIVVEKILRSMTRKFNYVVCAIEESNDVETLPIDGLQGSLLVHEQKMKPAKEEDQALKITHGSGNSTRGRGRGGRTNQGRGKRLNKDNIECYKCHRFGHFQYECPNNEDYAHYADYNENEEVLLMAFDKPSTSSVKSKIWYLDLGCSNHMCGVKVFFFDLDTSFRETVRLGDNSQMNVMGKGNVKLQMNGITQIITVVYYIPELKNNLLSIGQLQKKNLTFVLKNNWCKGCHQNKGLIMSSQLASNNLYPIITEAKLACFQGTTGDMNHLWHCRYGHLNYKSLQLLHQKNMFKCMVEKESNEVIYCLRTDRGGEFNSDAFREFFEDNGIKRQLTATYTPQPNGIAERKNRTIMDMVRSMLATKDIPKEFWPEAVNWAIHVLNRSPAAAIPDKTPEEAWSSSKPTVKHFKVFGCTAYTHWSQVSDPVNNVSEDSDEELDERNNVDEEPVNNSNNHHEDTPPEIQVNEHTSTSSLANTSDSNSNLDQGRIRKPPSWHADYYTTITEDEFIDEEAMNLIVFGPCVHEDPIKFEDAEKSQTCRAAMKNEIDSIKRNNTWELTDLPKGAKKEVFAPVARWDTIRCLLAIAAMKGWNVYQLDVKNAFLHGELNETVYVEQPLSFIKKGSEYKVYRLHKALYGLKQAPRAWYSKIEQYFIMEGFEKCPHEHTLFVKRNDDSDLLIISLYVDDLIFTGNNSVMVKGFKESMMKTFDMTDLGKMRHFLGIEVIQSEKGIFLCQQRYAKEVLERFKMDKSNGVYSPIVTGTKLSKHDKSEEVNPTQFKQIVGSLMYLTATRPDLMFAVHMIARFMEYPVETHMMAAKRILRYIRGTLELGVLYKRGNQTGLIAYSDSDYGGDVDDRKSTSGYVFMLGSGAISWSSRKQPIVTLSTTEAEFIAATHCVCQGIWLKRILESMGLKQQRCLDVFCDNISTIKLSKNPVLHGRSKHIDIRFHFLRNLSYDGTIEMKHCTSQNQIADIMTKALKLESFENLKRMLGVCSSSNMRE